MKHFIFLLLLSPFIVSAQQASAGPVFSEFGKVYEVSNPDFKTDLENDFKVVFDVMSSPGKEGARNRQLETAARFLNLHVSAGKDRDQLKVALVVHGSAAKDLLQSQAYEVRLGRPNPNEALVEALIKEGVEVIICGQSAHSRKLDRDKLIPGVKVALSAMTALIQLQNDGYQLIKF